MVQAAPPTSVQPAPKSVAQPAVPRADAEATTHLHWGRLGDAYRAQPGRQADAATAYRRAIELVDRQIADSGGDADLESWRALYVARLGDRATAVAGLDPLLKRTDIAPETMFRIAVTYELAGLRPRALMGVARAVRSGYPPKAVLAEPDLAELRRDPRFQRLATATPPRKRPRQ
jgi:hypothetical protein